MTPDTPDSPSEPKSVRPARSRPWWRPLVDGIDHRITPPANRLVRTNAFADLVAVTTRLEVRIRRRVERQSTSLLHLYNLPTATDMKRIRAQLSALEARTRDLGERLEDQDSSAKQGSRAGGPKDPPSRGTRG